MCTKYREKNQGKSFQYGNIVIIVQFLFVSLFFFSTFAFEAISIIKHITHLDPAGDSVASKPGLKVISASLCSNQHD